MVTVFRGISRRPSSRLAIPFSVTTVMGNSSSMSGWASGSTSP